MTRQLRETFWVKRVALVAAPAIVLGAALVMAKAAVDGNGDGCVDLADYAVMQAQFTGPECPTREILSFYAEGKGAREIIPAVPGQHGFMITDVHVSTTDPSREAFVALVQDITEVPRTLLKTREQTISLRSGIPVPSGSTVTVAGFDFSVMISGYTY